MNREQLQLIITSIENQRAHLATLFAEEQFIAEQQLISRAHNIVIRCRNQLEKLLPRKIL